VSASASRKGRGGSEFVLVNVGPYSVSVARELIHLVDKVVLDTAAAVMNMPGAETAPILSDGSLYHFGPIERAGPGFRAAVALANAMDECHGQSGEAEGRKG
jgi:hypothetical protein